MWPKKGGGWGDSWALRTGYSLLRNKDLFILLWLAQSLSLVWVLEIEVPNSMEKQCHQVSLNVVSSPREDAARPHLGGLNRVLRGPPWESWFKWGLREKSRSTLFIFATFMWCRHDYLHLMRQALTTGERLHPHCYQRPKLWVHTVCDFLILLHMD